MAKLFKRKEEVIQVYCQTCERDLTDVGGLLADNQGIYCNGHSKCFGGKIYAVHKNPDQVQLAIKNGILLNFGRLEQAASRVYA